MVLALVPDDFVLSTIFPDAKIKSWTILNNYVTVCTFKIEFDSEPGPGMPLELVVRITTDEEANATTHTCHAIASSRIPRFVTEVYSYGNLTKPDGTRIGYLVSKFCSDAVTLLSVWPSLSLSNVESLVDQVVEVVEKLQAIKLSDPKTRELLVNTAFQNGGDILMGGPFITLSTDMRGFLTQFVQKHQPRDPNIASTVTDTKDGLLFESVHPEFEKVFLSNDDLKALYNDVVFCHNDIEPRNLMVRQVEDNGESKYELAAVIDWDVAGFWPFAFDSAWKDCSLGSSNQHYEWYAFYKRKTRSFIPATEASIKLMKAVHLVPMSVVQGPQTRLCRDSVSLVAARTSGDE